MGSFGWHNPWPFEWGGGPTIVEKHYLVLRRAVGVGGSALDEESVEDLWRQRKAIMVAALDAVAERAFLQFFPDKAQDSLPYYEQLLGVVAGPGQSDEARRQAVVPAFIADALADTGRAVDSLLRIDERFGIIEQTHESAAATVLGRAFEPFNGSPDFDSGDASVKSSSFPNYSDDFMVTVLFSGSAVPGKVEREIIDQGARLLNTMLPAWVGFRIITGTGFILDQSPLDITGFGT